MKAIGNTNYSRFLYALLTYVSGSVAFKVVMAENDNMY